MLLSVVTSHEQRLLACVLVCVHVRHTEVRRSVYSL
jgi:hypothetical protein